MATVRIEIAEELSHGTMATSSEFGLVYTQRRGALDERVEREIIRLIRLEVLRNLNAMIVVKVETPVKAGAAR